MKTNTDISSLSRRQSQEVDRIAIEKYGMPGILLMENAGANASRIIRELSPEGARVAIVCGRGNNGGDGFVIARHLHNAGHPVELFLACDPASLSGDAALNYQIVERMAFPLTPFGTESAIASARSRLQQARVIVDAVLGTGFSGMVRPPVDSVIAAINTVRADASIKIIAIDVPSGLDCDTGQPFLVSVRADHTITFVAAKAGFRAPQASEWVGTVHVVGIGCPIEIVAMAQTAAPP